MGIKKREFKLGSRKGISPLIATILLIAFAVALGAMIMNWSSSLLSESRLEGECSKAKISLVGRFCLEEDKIKIEVLNSGQITVHSLVLHIIAEEFDNEMIIKDSMLSQNQRLVKQIPNIETSNANKYELTPRIGTDENTVTCSTAAIKLDRLEPC